MNFEPIILGVSAFIIIGFFHPVVIKAEYYFSYKIWPAFAIVGLALLGSTLFMQGLLAYITAFLGITCLWCIVELFHQKRRVEKGWYPKNPKRKNKNEEEESRMKKIFLTMIAIFFATTAVHAKTLVVYFSFPEDAEVKAGVDAISGASLVVKDGKRLGSVESVALQIQKETGADIFRIETVQDYPKAHSPLLNFTRDEQKKGKHPALKNRVENIALYDTIILAYPIWWYALPMPVWSFLDSYDLGGKTIYPVTVHGGSRLSGTEKEIAKAEPKATVSQNALIISRENLSHSQKQVSDWVKTIR